MKLIFYALLACLYSCSVYRAHFDCPPSRGVPCTSVSEIESRIIETSKGPDLFLQTKPPKEKCKIWINNNIKPIAHETIYD